MPYLYLELVYKSFQDAAIAHQQDLADRVDLFINGKLDNVVAGYEHGFGRKLRYPAVLWVFGNLIRETHRHILNFYLLLTFFILAVFILRVTL